MSDTRPLETPGADAPAPASAASAAAEQLPRPRIRTGAVIWGLLLTALGAWVLWIASTPARRADALDTVLNLGVFGWTVVAVVSVGALLALLALAAVIRRIQRRTTA